MVNSAAASNGAGKLLACTGQAAIQPIHDIHFVLSAVFIFDGSMAPTGQTLTHLPQFIHLLFRFGTTFKLPRRLYSWLPGIKILCGKIIFCKFFCYLLCKGSKFFSVLIIRAACAELAHNRMFCHSPYWCNRLKSLQFCNIRKFYKAVVISTVAVNRNTNTFCAVALYLFKSFYGSARNNTLIYRCGNNNKAVFSGFYCL